MTPTVFGPEGIFTVPHLLWNGTSVYSLIYRPALFSCNSGDLSLQHHLQACPVQSQLRGPQFTASSTGPSCSVATRDLSLQPRIQARPDQSQLRGPQFTASSTGPTRFSRNSGDLSLQPHLQACPVQSQLRGPSVYSIIYRLALFSRNLWKVRCTEHLLLPRYTRVHREVNTIILTYKATTLVKIVYFN